MDVKTFILEISLTIVGLTLTAMMISVMQHHAKQPQAASRAKSAAVDVLWTLVPCCMMVALVGTSLKAAWAS
jgi:heme/copper-type cytochrome/quinol oxidase subunit 2